MAELDPEGRELLAAFAEVATPSTDAAQAALAKVRARIDRGDDVVLIAAGPKEATPTSGPWLKIGVVVLALAAAVLLAIQLDVGSLVVDEAEREASPEAAAYPAQDDGVGGEAVQRRPAPKPRAKPKVTPTPVPEAEDVLEPEPEPETPAIKPKKRRPKQPDATTSAEIALMQPAKRALRSGSYARALELYKTHAQSFPSSKLAEERELGRIQALCGLGRGDEARALAGRFARRFPGSPLRAKAKVACPAP
jgi:hypothetical protein